MPNKNIIRAFEHQTIKQGDVDGVKFEYTHFKSLVKYNEKHGNKYFTVGDKKLTFHNYVGVIQVNNITIEILPKADKKTYASKDKWQEALLTMLRECRKLKVESLSEALLTLKSSSLLDLYYYEFLKEVENIIHQGFRKKYKKVSGNTKYLKGRLLFNQQINKNLIHKERFYTEHQVYSRDHLINRILLKALNITSFISNNPAIKNKAEKLKLEFEGIQDVNIIATDFEKVNFSINNEHYRQGINLAKMIILNYSPDLKGGHESVLAILFDMNKLYENFIYRQLKKFEKTHNLKVVDKKHNLVIVEKEKQYFWENNYFEPDIIVRKNDKTVIIDTKWKVLKNHTPDINDLRQMYAYNMHYKSNLSILLYPEVGLEQKDKKPFYLKKRSDKRDNEDEEHYCQLGFISLFSDEENPKLRNDLGDLIYKEFLEEQLKSTQNEQK